MLALLGFAATDFVITKTLSAADAAEHLMHNPAGITSPQLHSRMPEGNQRMAVTMTLLVMLGASFMRSFKEVIGLAVVIVGGYLVFELAGDWQRAAVSRGSSRKVLRDWYDKRGARQLALGVGAAPSGTAGA